MRSVNGKPSTAGQMKDAVTIVLALANEYRDDGRFSQVVDILQKVIQLNPSLNTDDNNGIVFNMLGIAFLELGDYEDAIFFHERALDIATNLFGENSLNVATVLSNLGISNNKIKKNREAKELYERALSIYDSNQIKDHPNRARDLSNLSVALLGLEQNALAIQLLQEALQISMKHFDEDAPNIARIRSCLGLAYYKTGNIDIASKLLAEVLDSDLRNFGKDHHVVGEDYFDLGTVLMTKGQYPEAREAYEKSYDILKIKLGVNHPSTLLGWGEL